MLGKLKESRATSTKRIYWDKVVGILIIGLNDELDCEYSLSSSVLSASSFAVATSVGTVRTDCIFHLTVIN